MKKGSKTNRESARSKSYLALFASLEVAKKTMEKLQGDPKTVEGSVRVGPDDVAGWWRVDWKANP